MASCSRLSPVFPSAHGPPPSAALRNRALRTTGTEPCRRLQCERYDRRQDAARPSVDFPARATGTYRSGPAADEAGQPWHGGVEFFPLIGKIGPRGRHSRSGILARQSVERVRRRPALLDRAFLRVDRQWRSRNRLESGDGQNSVDRARPTRRARRIQRVPCRHLTEVH